MVPPPEKKQKTEEEEAKDVPMAEEKKGPEPPKELEEDAKPLKGPKAAEAVEFLVPDTTVNVMPSLDGGLLMALQDNGLQHLLAGARASVGVKSGRFMFEVKIVECPSPSDQSGPYPRSLLKIGFSTAGSSTILDSDETSVSFDSEGHFSGAKTRAKVSQKLVSGDVVACLLNLEKGSPNCNTLSLFKGGNRISQPQAIPEGLVGKALFPTVAFKCMTLSANFGPSPICDLPFSCHMVGSALKSQAEVSTHTPLATGEVLMPVSLPDEGSFDWLDMFLEKNPGYTEISDRAIRAWVEKSSAWSKRGVMPKSSNDKPEMGFGVHKLDDGYSVKKTLKAFCALQKRKFIVMEVKGNLVKEERAAALEPFKSAGFKTSAAVLVGTPPADFKKRSQELLLKAKQDAVTKEHKDKFEAEKKKWLFMKKQKELEKARKKAAKEKEKMAKAKAKAAAKALEEAKKKAQAAKDGEAAEEEKKEEPAEEEPEEDEPEEEDEAMEPEPVEEDPPVATLDAEEKKLSFRPLPVPDLTQFVLNTTFTKFTIPDKEEGFDEIKYEFLKDAAKSTKYVEDWVSSRKLTTRVEDVTPSNWFFTTKKGWDKAVQDWNAALNKYKSDLAKKRADKAAKERKKAQAAAKAAALKAKAEADKAKAEAEKKEGEDKEEEKKEEEAPAEEVEEEAEEEEEPEVDLEGVDVWVGVDDVKDIGGGMPLYKAFTPDDWTLMGLAFELHLLTHSFKKDVKDEDRAGIHIDHLDFYYQKYYKKPLGPKAFGKDTVQEVVELVKDVVYVNGKGKLVACLAEEMETYQVFVKIAEEARRFRALSIDAGEESAVLKISVQHGSQQNHGGQGQKRKQEWGNAGKGGWGQQPPWGAQPAGKKAKGGGKSWGK